MMEVTQAETSGEVDTHRMIVKFPKPLHQRLKLLAVRQGVTMTSIIVEAVSASVEISEEALGVEQLA